TLRARLDTRPLAQFWNVLTNDYYTGALIPGSRHVPVDRVGREAATLGLAKDAEIVVYCSGITCPNSAQAAHKLATLGYTNVSVFEGGLADWSAAGLPTECETANA